MMAPLNSLRKAPDARFQSYDTRDFFLVPGCPVVVPWKDKAGRVKDWWDWWHYGYVKESRDGHAVIKVHHKPKDQVILHDDFVYAMSKHVYAVDETRHRVIIDNLPVACAQSAIDPFKLWRDPVNSQLWLVPSDFTLGSSFDFAYQPCELYTQVTPQGGAADIFHFAKPAGCSVVPATQTAAGKRALAKPASSSRRKAPTKHTASAVDARTHHKSSMFGSSSGTAANAPHAESGPSNGRPRKRPRGKAPAIESALPPAGEPLELTTHAVEPGGRRVQLILSPRSATGYLHVTYSRHEVEIGKPYAAEKGNGGGLLGYFATPVEAALRYAQWEERRAQRPEQQVQTETEAVVAVKQEEVEEHEEATTAAMEAAPEAAAVAVDAPAPAVRTRGRITIEEGSSSEEEEEEEREAEEAVEEEEEEEAMCQLHSACTAPPRARATPRSRRAAPPAPCAAWPAPCPSASPCPRSPKRSGYKFTQEKSKSQKNSTYRETSRDISRFTG
jgi:hypothetical protein